MVCDFDGSIGSLDCCELIQPNSPVRIVVAVAYGRPCNHANLSTIKVSNSSFLAYGLVYGL